jgi:3-phosphoshikimate 1-carboxyvinyltransferase
MAQIIVYPTEKLFGEIEVDGDKSITHRALMHAGLANGKTRIRNFLSGNDCLATMQCMRDLGVEIDLNGNEIIATGHGLYVFKTPVKALDCVRSGTAMRLLMGLLCGQGHESILLDADTQLKQRPMERVAIPLRTLGAHITTTEGKAPILILHSQLHGGLVELSVPSAQVKSAVIYAGLYAEGETIVRQNAPTRDHTERMLMAQGADIRLEHADVVIGSDHNFTPLDMLIPGDISSAAFPIAAGVLCAGSKVSINSVGLNETRTGFLDILKQFGYTVKIINPQNDVAEPYGTIIVEHAGLSATQLFGDIIVRAIDEIPLAALLATQAEGRTIIRDAQELRVKETDRIASISAELNQLGARIQPTADGMIVDGPTVFQGTTVDSHGDHRIAMALFIAGLIARGETRIEGFECVTDSFPGFLQVMKTIGARYA